jgi:hypothetical protein
LVRLCARCCGVALPGIDKEALAFLLEVLGSVTKYRPSNRSSALGEEEGGYEGDMDVVSPDDARRAFKKIFNQRGGETVVLGELYDHMMRRVVMLREPAVRTWKNTICCTPQMGAELRIDKFLLLSLELYDDTKSIKAIGSAKGSKRKRRKSLVVMQMMNQWMGGRTPGWSNPDDASSVVIQRQARLWLLRARIKREEQLLTKGFE